MRSRGTWNTSSAEQSTDDVGRDHYRGTEESLREVAASSYLVVRSTKCVHASNSAKSVTEVFTSLTTFMYSPRGETTDNLPTQRTLVPYSLMDDEVFGGAGEVYACVDLLLLYHRCQRS